MIFKQKKKKKKKLQHGGDKEKEEAKVRTDVAVNSISYT